MATLLLTGRDGTPLIVNWDNVTFALEVSKFTEHGGDDEIFDYTKVSFVETNGSSTLYLRDTVPEIYAKLAEQAWFGGGS